MTIIFHEGLPGAGKSYEAVVKRVIPALKAGRKVFAYIDGLNFEKIAEAGELELDDVKRLLVQLQREQMASVYDHVENDALVVLDEAQNFWPQTFGKLGAEITAFVSEHRRRGLDIVLMGQDLRDVHTLWRRRVDQKIIFTKMDVVGKVDSYQWASFKHVGKEKYEKITSGRQKYDTKYFGTYLSHEAGTTNKETFVDERAIIWNSPVFRRWLPLFGIVLVIAIGIIVYMFKGDGLTKSAGAPAAKPAPHSVTTVKVEKSERASPPPAAASAPAAAAPKQQDFIAGLNEKYRVRLSAMMRKAGRAQLIIEWYDAGYRVQERLLAHQIEELGWRMELSAYGEHVILIKGDTRVVATMWPMEPVGRVSRETNNAIRMAGGGRAPKDSVDLAVFDQN